MQRVPRNGAGLSRPVAPSAGVPRSFDPSELHQALALVPPSAWSLPSTFEATKVHHGYRRVVLAHLGPFAGVLEQFAPVRDAWLSQVDPAGFIVPHRDAGPYYERWQVPIATAGYMDQGTPEAATDGVPFRVHHWLPHSVANHSDKPRIHLIIDRNVLVPVQSQPFSLFDSGAASCRLSVRTT